MGLSAVFTSALKGLSWQKIAGLAMAYGPELYRQARGHFPTGDGPPAPSPAEVELEERVARLEKLLLEQEELIKAQSTRNEQLEAVCLQLEHRLNRVKIICAVLTGVAIILVVMLLRHG